MTDSAPTVKLTVHPANVIRLNHGDPIRAGGVRVRTIIYIVTEPDIPNHGRQPDVATIVVAPNGSVELRAVD